MKSFYFIRHGQTEWNAIARMQGQWNSDLNDRGKAQADANGVFLATQNLDAFYASPLDRTRQTALIINQYLDLPISYDDRLKEWDCGDWSGELYAEVANKWVKEWEAFEADRFNYRGPNCENYPDMIERSKPFIDALKLSTATNIGIVSHGIIGRVMIAQLMGLNEQQTLDFKIGNDVVFKVTLDNKNSIVKYVGGKGPEPVLDI
ncbi:MAG: phosphoglycerate mutase family protein [Pseudomonadales bacterium]|nr:phosphoglycerate mutase family protein [Pseudomonadales bacterium]